MEDIAVVETWVGTECVRVEAIDVSLARSRYDSMTWHKGEKGVITHWAFPEVAHGSFGYREPLVVETWVIHGFA